MTDQRTTDEKFDNLINHWEGDHFKAADQYEDAGGNPYILTYAELQDLHEGEH